MLDMQAEYVEVVKKPMEKPIEHRGLNLGKYAGLATLIRVSIP